MTRKARRERYIFRSVRILRNSLSLMAPLPSSSYWSNMFFRLVLILVMISGDSLPSCWFSASLRKASRTNNICIYVCL